MQLKICKFIFIFNDLKLIIKDVEYTYTYYYYNVNVIHIQKYF